MANCLPDRLHIEKKILLSDAEINKKKIHHFLFHQLPKRGSLHGHYCSLYKELAIECHSGSQKAACSHGVLRINRFLT